MEQQHSQDKRSRFARCRCFLESNVFLKRFGLHVTFKTIMQFTNCYGKILAEMGCTDLRPIISEIETELERRKRIPYDSINRANYIKTNYKPLNPDVFVLEENILHPDMLQLCTKLREGKLDKAARGLYKTHGNEIYSFPIFNSGFCSKLISEIDYFNSLPMPKGRPNSMNNHGVLLDELGFNEGLLTPLRQKYLEPLSQYFFPQETPKGFNSHKVFTVDYEENKDIELDFHFDNSEITINVCLLADCDGGELYFGSPNSNDGFGYEHKKGRAVMHKGSALHCVMPLVKGRRINLVMWMRSSAIRNLKCPMCKSTPDLDPVERGWGDGFTIE